MARRSAEFDRIETEVVACRRCPRLVAWREEAARHPPRRFAGQVYWARPIPAFGDPTGRIAIVYLDHLLRGIFWPQSVYGVLAAPVWRSLEHAGWVIFEVSFLIISWPPICAPTIGALRGSFSLSWSNRQLHFRG